MTDRDELVAKIARLEDERASLAQDLAAMDARRQVTEAQLLALLGSTSWRVTRAIRAPIRLLRGEPAAIVELRRRVGRIIRRARLDQQFGQKRKEVGDRYTTSSPNATKSVDAADIENLVLTGKALLEECRLDEAIVPLQAAVVAAPTHGLARVNLGLTLRLLDRLPEAEEHLTEATRLISGPGSESILNSLGLTICEQGRFDKALPWFEAALTQNPTYQEARKNRELAVLLLERDGPGTENYTRDHALDSETMEYCYRASLFAQNKFPEVWSWSYQQRQKQGWLTVLGPEWDGADPVGKTILLVHQYMGLGDGFFLVRFASVLAAMGARVVVLAPPTLTRLYCTVPGVSAVASEPELLPPYDLTADMGFLPHFLGGDLGASSPTPVPYMTPFPEDVTAWKERLSSVPGLKVGVAWSGGVNPRRIAFHRHLRRHFPLAQLASLAAIPGVSLVNLQVDSAKAQIASAGVPLLDFTESINDYADTAALIANLALVVTVDTSIAHCVGALGKPVWILLQYGIAPLWPTEGSDYPWYPSARLFHQSEPGNWDSVFTEVTDELTKLSKQSLSKPHLADLTIESRRELDSLRAEMCLSRFVEGGACGLLKARCRTR